MSAPQVGLRPFAIESGPLQAVPARRVRRGADYATLAAASIGHSEGHILYPVRPTAAKHTGQGKQTQQIAEVGRVRGSRPMGQEDH